MPTECLPESSCQKCPGGGSYEVSCHKNSINAVRSTRTEFEDTGLIAQLDTLHADIDDDDTGNDSPIGVLSDKEKQPR